MNLLKQFQRKLLTISALTQHVLVHTYTLDNVLIHTFDTGIVCDLGTEVDLTGDLYLATTARYNQLQMNALSNGSGDIYLSTTYGVLHEPFPGVFSKVAEDIFNPDEDTAGIIIDLSKHAHIWFGEEGISFAKKLILSQLINDNVEDIDVDLSLRQVGFTLPNPDFDGDVYHETNNI